jgi:glutamate--cysteine ligase
MSTRQEGAQKPPVRSRDDLVAWLAEGAKPRADWQIGTEHEKFVFHTGDLTPVPYEGERSIRALMQSLIDRFGWLPVMEGSRIIALNRADGEPGGTISLEPGGQFELSGRPVATLHDTAEETQDHFYEVLNVGEALGIGFLGLGFSPKWTLAETPRMPKDRYGIMTRYMPTVGTQGLDMMYRTATIQVNLDFADEADMVKKLRVSLALQPIAAALFAASPFTEGRLNGFKSMRSEVWRHTDPARTGMLPFAFEPGMGFERYVDYALKVPMYFVYRNGRYIDASGACFEDFLEGRLAALPGERPTLDDWSDHLTTLFPEVRLKRFLEMRGADGGPWQRICALSAFWVGLLYDASALDEAWTLVSDWTQEEREALRANVPRSALATPFRNTTVQHIARSAVAIARKGLRNRQQIKAGRGDESAYLLPLQEVAETGRTLADELIARFEGPWGGDIDHVFEEYAF